MKTLISIAICILALSAAADAPAQVSLPTLPDLPGTLTQTLPQIEDQELASRALRNARQIQLRDLLRAHRDELEADPDGQPIVRGQILAITANTDALAVARAAGFEILRRDRLDGLGEMVTLRAPERVSTRRALRGLREADPAGLYDYDHLHLVSGDDRVAAPSPPPAHQRSSAGRRRIGLIDGGVADTALIGSIAAQRGFVTDAAVPSAHASIIARLLVPETGPDSDASIFVADIYGGAPTGGASSAMARALSWLATQNVPVINVSLVGPRNRVVETMTTQLTERGFVIVAAVGNDGPAAPPLYPAAYAGVIGVTGVDARDRVLIEAGRGPQVDFAARGVVETGSGPNRASVRGTSYAAPIVARLIAEEMREPDPAGALLAQNRLRTRAHDLGARGRDEVYGEGLVGSVPPQAQAR